MSIKCKLGEVVNAFESKALAVLVNLERLPAKSAYDAVKLLKLVPVDVDAFNEARGKLARELGTPDEKGSFTIEQGTDAMRKFVAEIQKLAEREVEYQVSRVALPKWKDDEPCPLTPVQLSMLLPFLAEIPGVTDAAEEAKDGDAERKEDAKS